MSISFCSLYHDRSLKGENLLAPFKHSVEKFGRAFNDWTVRENANLSDKLWGILTRIADFIAGIFGMIGTSFIVPVGVAVKFFSQADEISDRERGPKQNSVNTEDGDKYKESYTESNNINTEGLVDKGTLSSTETNINENTKFEPKKEEKKTPDLETEIKIQQAQVKNEAPKANEENKLFAEKVHAYPGNLTAEQKATIVAQLQDPPNALQINFINDDVGLSYTIRNQNMFKSGAKAIVNAANTHLGGGSGIDGAIHDAGGTEYANAHKELKIKYKSNYTEGFAAMITSGELRDRHGIHNVIVVAGPRGNYNLNKAGKLYSCYFNSMVLAHNSGIESLAFPSISTGIFGFPKNHAAEIVLRAMHDFHEAYPVTRLKTISVHFMAKDPTDDFAYYTDALKTEKDD